MDGFSLLITYSDRKFVMAATRGTGSVGDDISPNAIQFHGIPKTLPESAPMGKVYIRGEGLLPVSTFKKKYPQLNEDGKPTNARNTGNGMAKAKTLKPYMNFADIHFVAYDLVFSAVYKTEEEKLAVLEGWGFEVPEHRVFDNPSDLEKYYIEVSNRRPSLDYVIDGLVIKINDLALQNKFDVVDGRPRGMVALKFPSSTVVATVKAVVWEMGLSGRFCPVAEVEPVTLGDPSGQVTLRRVSLHNLKQVLLYKVTPGAKILVERSGDIIPHLVKVVSPGVPFLK